MPAPSSSSILPSPPSLLFSCFLGIDVGEEGERANEQEAKVKHCEEGRRPELRSLCTSLLSARRRREEEEGGGCDAFRLFQTCANKNLFSASNVPFRAPFGYCRRQVLIDRRADAASLPQIPTRIEEAGNAAPDVGGRFTHSIHPAPDRQSLRGLFS